MAAQAPVASIGDISELTGTAEVIRDEPYGAVLDFDIQQMDDVRTSVGRVAITFLDDSIVKLTEHSKLVITNMCLTLTQQKARWLCVLQMAQPDL